MKNLLACFRAFIKRGSIVEWCKVLPEDTSASDVCRAIKHVRTSADNAGVAGISPHQSPDPSELPEAYFKKHMNPLDNNRLKRLIRIATRTAKTNVAQSFPVLKPTVGFASTKADSEAGAKAQATALYHAIHELPEAARFYYRFSLLVFGHVLERYAALPLQLKKGQKSISVAFEAIAKASDADKSLVKKTYEHSNVYLKCAKIGGLGSLISLDGSKSE
jgi:hypothetical protein